MELKNREIAGRSHGKIGDDRDSKLKSLSHDFGFATADDHRSAGLFVGSKLEP